jgi:hypothetical protein
MEETGALLLRDVVGEAGRGGGVAREGAVAVELLGVERVAGDRRGFRRGVEQAGLAGRPRVGPEA